MSCPILLFPKKYESKPLTIESAQDLIGVLQLEEFVLYDDQLNILPGIDRTDPIGSLQKVFHPEGQLMPHRLLIFCQTAGGRAAIIDFLGAINQTWTIDFVIAIRLFVQLSLQCDSKLYRTTEVENSQELYTSHTSFLDFYPHIDVVMPFFEDRATDEDKARMDRFLFQPWVGKQLPVGEKFFET